MISIIMAAYNSEDTIAEAIDSIRRQTYTDWELLVVDDCSTDHTTDIVREYIKPLDENSRSILETKASVVLSGTKVTYSSLKGLLNVI